MAVDETSTSGEITTAFENVSDVFTSYSEIPSSGFNRLHKAQRYGKWFVLKGLKPEFQRKEVYTRLLTKEFELGVRMDHPNIVHTFSFETDPVVGPCIVMEYVDGVTLKEYLTRNPDRATRMRIVQELLSAMSYCHSKQIVHRDLKPDNILITRNGHNVKIIDFGLADSDYHGILKQPAGSDKYAAPEQKAGTHSLDCRADLYSFGKILRLLFPHAYGRIARKCTQEDRERRFSNAEEIQQRFQRRNRWLPILIVLGALLFVAFGAWILLQFSDNSVRKDVQNMDKQEMATQERTAGDVHVSSGMNATSDPMAGRHPTMAADNGNPTEKAVCQRLPVEVRRSIEQSVDAVFQPFWDWDRAATARGVSSVDKLAEYVESDFYKNNYEIRERHREAIVNDILRRYPQCEPIKDSVTMFYNSTFVRKMVAVNNVVQEWQKAAR